MSEDDARMWLRANGYSDIADIIDELIEEWKADGKKTRRNWWDILAGDANGQPRSVQGREFPVLRAAQIRQGRKPTDNAIQRGTQEKVRLAKRPRKA